MDRQALVDIARRLAMRPASAVVEESEAEAARAEIESDPEAVYAALCSQFGKMGTYTKRTPRLVESDPQHSRRSASRDALRVHMRGPWRMCESYLEARQSAMGWFWFLVAGGEGGRVYSRAGAIGVAAKRVLRAFPVDGCSSEPQAWTFADETASKFDLILGVKRPTPVSAWDWIDYQACRESLGVTFVRRLVRGEGSVVSAVECERWDAFASDLPVPPAVSGSAPAVRRERPVWSRCPAVCPASERAAAQRLLLSRERRSVLSNRERSRQWGCDVRATDRDRDDERWLSWCSRRLSSMVLTSDNWY